MFQSDSADDNALFSALHLRHNKHKVVLFHVVDTKTELKFDFDNTPEVYRCGDWRNRCGFSDNVKEEYEKQAALYFKS
jgi:hypothetical protein